MGCSRNERKVSLARSRSPRAGGYALVTSPMASPAIVGWMPDLNIATQSAVPTTAAAGPRATGA